MELDIKNFCELCNFWYCKSEGPCRINITIYDSQQEYHFPIGCLDNPCITHEVVCDIEHRLKIGEYSNAYYCKNLLELERIVCYLSAEARDMISNN